MHKIYCAIKGKADGYGPEEKDSNLVFVFHYLNIPITAGFVSRLCNRQNSEDVKLLKIPESQIQDGRLL